MLFNSRAIVSLVILIAALVLSHCTKGTAQSTSGVSDLIKISYDTGPKIEVGENLEFWIRNESNRCVSFPLGYGIKLFVEEDQTWMQVPNLARYSGEGPILLKPKGDIFSENFVGLRPDVSGLNLTAPTEFYASITGSICDDESVIVEKNIPFTVTP